MSPPQVTMENEKPTQLEGNVMSIIGWLVLGLIAGFIASRIVNKTGEGVILDIVLGIIGAVVGASRSPSLELRRYRFQSLQHACGHRRCDCRAGSLSRDRPPDCLSYHIVALTGCLVI